MQHTNRDRQESSLKYWTVICSKDIRFNVVIVNLYYSLICWHAIQDFVCNGTTNLLRTGQIGCRNQTYFARSGRFEFFCYIIINRCISNIFQIVHYKYIHAMSQNQKQMIHYLMNIITSAGLSGKYNMVLTLSQYPSVVSAASRLSDGSTVVTGGRYINVIVSLQLPLGEKDNISSFHNRDRLINCVAKLGEMFAVVSLRRAIHKCLIQVSSVLTIIYPHED